MVGWGGGWGGEGGRGGSGGDGRAFMAEHLVGSRLTRSSIPVGLEAEKKPMVTCVFWARVPPVTGGCSTLPHS